MQVDGEAHHSLSEAEEALARTLLYEVGGGGAGDSSSPLLRWASYTGGNAAIQRPDDSRLGRWAKSRLGRRFLCSNF